jgi:hypothetical protein
MKWKSRINQMVKMLKDNTERLRGVLSCKEVKNNTKSLKESERLINLDQRLALLGKSRLNNSFSL